MKKKNELTFKVGKRIAKLRRSRGLTQEKFSELSDISVNTISIIECGYTDPQLSTLNAFAKALEMDTGEMISGAIQAPLGRARSFDKLIEKTKDKDEKFIVKVIAAVDILAS